MQVTDMAVSTISINLKVANMSSQAITHNNSIIPIIFRDEK